MQAEHAVRIFRVQICYFES